MKIMNIYGLVVALFVMVACTNVMETKAYTEGSERLNNLAIELSLLSDALQGYVYQDYYDKFAQDKELLDKATRHDPSLLSSFHEYYTKAFLFDVDGIEYGYILICDAEQKQAILEDATCTSNVEKRLWYQNAPCAMSLDLKKICM